MHDAAMSRRHLLRGVVSVGALGIMGGTARAAGDEDGKINLKKGTVILFQGDSITDAGRNKGVQEPNSE